MFEDFPQDVVTLLKNDGRVIPDFKAIVQPDLVVVPGDSLPLEEGDLFSEGYQAEQRSTTRY